MVKPQDEDDVTDQLYGEIKPALDGANYIVKHMHNKNDYNEVRREDSGKKKMDRFRKFNLSFVVSGEGQLERDRPDGGPALPLPHHSGDDARHHHRLSDGNL